MLEVNDLAVIQLLKELGLDVENTKVVFQGKGVELGFYDLGRVLTDKEDLLMAVRLLSQKRIDVNGNPINPLNGIILTSLFKQEFLR